MKLLIIVKSVFNKIMQIGNFILGGIDKLLFSLILFILIEIVSGLMLVLVRKKRVTDLNIKGLCKKFSIFLVIAISNIIDTYILNADGILRAMTILFYISITGLSILHKINKIGVVFPKALKHILEKVAEQTEENICSESFDMDKNTR